MGVTRRDLSDSLGILINIRRLTLQHVTLLVKLHLKLCFVIHWALIAAKEAHPLNIYFVLRFHLSPQTLAMCPAMRPINDK